MRFLLIYLALANVACSDLGVSTWRRFPPKPYNSITNEIMTTFNGMSAYNSNFTLDSNFIAYGSGTYSVYYSSVRTMYGPTNAFKSFDFRDYSKSLGGALWDATYSLSTGEYLGNKFFLDSRFGGEWVVLKLPMAIAIKSYTIVRRSWTSTTAARAPNNFTLHASKDGRSWTILDSSNATTYTNHRFTSYLNNTDSYAFIALTVHKIFPSNDGGILNIMQLILYDDSGEIICTNGTFKASPNNKTGCTKCLRGTFTPSHDLAKTCGPTQNTFCQGSVDFGEGAQNGNDGNLSSYFQTQCDVPDKMSWKLDLEYPRSIQGGRIWNRRDAFWSRLDGYTIWVGNNGTVFNGNGNVNCFGAVSDSHSIGPFYDSNFSCVAQGRFLFVYLAEVSGANTCLHFSEIEVYPMHATSCWNCPAGHIQAQEGNNICDACTNGTYMSTTGASACTNCKTCSHMHLTWCVESGLSRDTVTCSCNASHYLNGSLDSTQCLMCPANTFLEPNNTEIKQEACQCNSGYTCIYNHNIIGHLRIGISLEAFTPLVQQNLIEAVSRAAVVNPSRLTISKITQLSQSRRRLLGLHSLRKSIKKGQAVALESKDDEIEVQIKIENPKQKIKTLGNKFDLKPKHKLGNSIRILKEAWTEKTRLTILKT